MSNHPFISHESVWDALMALRISYFDVGNVVHLLKSKWSQDVHDGKPMSCEGVLCTSRLQVLAHTIAHEMVSYGT